MKIYKCSKVSPGIARAKVLRSEEPVLFYHTDPKTGEITEKEHSLLGKSVCGKIMVFPGGKGSSVVQADGIYRLEQNHTAPAGFMVEHLDTVLVATAVIMEIPMVWKVEKEFFEETKDDDMIEVDADHGEIRVLKQKG